MCPRFTSAGEQGIIWYVSNDKKGSGRPYQMLTYDLQKRGRSPLYYALYRAIREDIAAGTLPPGEKLPSKRALAEHLGVSVVTVEGAYRLLIDEGYVSSRERSGFYVRAVGAERIGPAPGREPLRLLPEEPASAGTDFPYSLWSKTLRRVISDQGSRLADRPPNEGCAVLRNAIARYLLRYRGMYAQPERIVVGSGSEQLYGFVARMLAGRTFAIEWPSYGQIEAVYKGAGAAVERLPIGAAGIESGALAAATAQVLHVTPFHSWPTGVTAPAAKRYEYLQWAAARPGRYIVEDDFDSEFFMPGKPLESLYSMDERGAVIYLNTFSRSLAPSMRMGYMILPEALLPDYRERVGMYSCSVPVLEQYALAAFLDEGHFERHLNRVRRRRERTE